VSGSSLTSDLVPFDSSAPVCPVGRQVSGGDIGVIVVGSALAIILIVIIFLWFYKWRRAWNNVATVAGVKKDVRELTERMVTVEDFVKSQPHEVDGRQGREGRHAREGHPEEGDGVEEHEMEGHGVEPPGRHGSFGTSDMAADAGHLERIIQNLVGRMQTLEATMRPQPVIRPGTNPFRNGTVTRERHGSNVSSETPDRTTFQGIEETQLGRRNTSGT
jgi:hypothetical protein